MLSEIRNALQDNEAFRAALEVFGEELGDRMTTEELHGFACGYAAAIGSDIQIPPATHAISDSHVFDPTADVRLPKSWRIMQKAIDGAAFRRDDGLLVIMSGAVEEDGRRWLHVSVSRKDRLPSWKEVILVKTLFIGAARYAYQVLPDHRKHVNIHPNCLHLWATRSSHDDPIPDFTRGGQSI